MEGRGRGGGSERERENLKASMSKRSRYSDVYNGAFCSDSVSAFIDCAMKRFRTNPSMHVSLPRHVDRMLRTQTIARGTRGGGEVRWAVRLAQYVEGRAARLISRRVLEFLYAPSGPWVRRRVEAMRTQGWGGM